MGTKNADIVKAYLREHPDTPSRTIAMYLDARYPGSWSSFEACYSMVRRYRGNAGERSRKDREGKETFVRIPAPARKKKQQVKLTTPGRWLIISDLHVPYHDQRAVEAAINYGIEQRCDHLLINGDALDCYQQSCWVKDPNQRSTDKEILLLKKLLHGVKDNFKGERVYKIGNHEERIENYLFMNAPKMIGMRKWDLGEQLKKELEIPEFQMIASKQLYMLGRLNGYHGHELPRGLTNPVSVGRGVWLRTKQTGFTSHHHSTSTHIESNGSKTKTWVCFSLGCLCDLHPDYAPINGWNHGFAVVDIDKHGNFKEQNLRVVNGAIW